MVQIAGLRNIAYNKKYIGFSGPVDSESLSCFLLSSWQRREKLSSVPCFRREKSRIEPHIFCPPLLFLCVTLQPRAFLPFPINLKWEGKEEEFSFVLWTSSFLTLLHCVTRPPIGSPLKSNEISKYLPWKETFLN